MRYALSGPLDIPAAQTTSRRNERFACERSRNVARTCRHFGISRQAFYRWKRRYEALGPLSVRSVVSRTVGHVLARLRNIPEYVELFRNVFGPGTSIDASQLGQAIAAFERTLVAMDSPFDRFRAGDANALTAQQRRGLEAFDEAGCDRCHDGPMFSDFDLHAEGVRENPKLTQPDTGGGGFRFRTPSLRNVALTAPYMHNGTLATLQDVLRFYDNGRSENPNVSNDTARRSRRDDVDRRTPRLDRDFQRVDDMSENEMKDIIAFLESLTDPAFDRKIPPRVPSGLNPGGRITPR